MSSTETSEAGYAACYVQRLQHYLKVSGEQVAVSNCVTKLLPEEFKRIGSGKSHVEVLGLGSGGGEIDIHILKTLQSVLPSLHMSAEAVEPSAELIKNFQDLVARTSSLQNVPFEWHTLTSAEYEKKVTMNKAIKKFDLIHMIQMLYYVDDYAATIKFFHSLLKSNGKILIVHEAANSGWDILWKSYRKTLCKDVSISDYLSAGDIKVHIDNLGLKYDEFVVPHSYDITDCFNPDSEVGELLLDYMTEQEHFHQSLTPEVRKGILDLLRNKCSTEKDGRVMFNSDLSCILVYA
ncbi:Histamine N-methyltransferase [Merluccius polli]|uniref:Histamine N-methyltransferase n=1 Tax=Merluccius polli TaxID=89951 RepID=A0AA47MP73_MERPO|nr:Histamine N-methyltransferase [Merluccius polli]